MQLNEFEKHIADNINKHSSEIDTDMLWATMEEDLDRKKRRRYGLLLLMIGLLAAIGFFIRSSYSEQGIQEVNDTQSESSSVIHTQVNERTQVEVGDSQEKQSDHVVSRQDALVEVSDKVNQTSSRLQETVTSKYRDVDASANVGNEDQRLTNQSRVEEATILSPSINSTFTSKGKADTHDFQLIPFDYLATLTGKAFSLNLPTEVDMEILDRRVTRDWSLYVNSGVGVYYTNRRIVARNQTGDILKSLRNNTETSLETISLGTGIEVRHHSNFFLDLGVSIHQLSERFDYQTIESATETIEIITEINYFANGVIEEVTGLYDQSQEIITDLQSYNTLRWTELSIGGGYLLSKGRWEVGGSGGMLWGAFLGARGRILDESSQVMRIENAQSPIYNNNVGLGAYANLDIRYALHRRCSLSTQLGYKYYSQSFTDPNYDLGINYGMIGARVGLHYRIN